MAMIEPAASGARYRLRVRRSLVLSSLVLSLLVVPLAVAQQSDRAKSLSMRMMCVCGCNQILGVCNHVGCTYSHDMLREIDTRVGRSESDDLIVQNFVQEYGAAVLLLPAAKGFNLWMWLMPIIAVIGGIVVVRFALVHWRRKAAEVAPSRVSADLIARARREMGPDE
ncbi:MAG: cytochrome c-type biogenesis protein CcmH [Candidatus Acidiferrales bacterium]|jgi:cytochrome c-type biogenesis protein CcmH